MKQALVKIDGATVYETKVSGERVRVVVTSSRAPSGQSGQVRFVCRRVDTGKLLPKPRPAAALHEVKS